MGDDAALIKAAPGPACFGWVGGYVFQSGAHGPPARSHGFLGTAAAFPHRHHDHHASTSFPSSPRSRARRSSRNGARIGDAVGTPGLATRLVSTRRFSDRQGRVWARQLRQAAEIADQIALHPIRSTRAERLPRVCLFFIRTVHLAALMPP